jgi:RNA polymerase sigma-70 factor (ECF subfamily)
MVVVASAVVMRPNVGGREIDERTLARAARSDSAACRTFVETYERAVFALLGRMLGPAGLDATVPDVAQETFVRAFAALRTFRPDGSARVSTWVLTIATRLAIDELRRRRPVVSLDHAAEVADPRGADDPSRERRLARAVERAAAALSSEQRAAFVLRAYHDLEYTEIARALGIDVGTAKSRVSRARAVLQAALAEELR